MSIVSDKKTYVATYKEILLSFVAFSIILIVLHPKDLLQQQILSEKKNYDLSMLYLQNMLQNDPENETLMLALAEQSLNSGKKDLSAKLLELLEVSKDETVRAKAFVLRFKLAKDDYFYFEKYENKVQMRAKYEELRTLFEQILSNHYYSKTDLKSLREEAYFLDDKENNLLLLKKMLLEKENDIELIKEAFYLTSNLDKTDEALYYIDRLIELDKKHATKWNEDKYYLFLKDTNYKKAESYIKKQAKNSMFWSDKLADFYIYHKKYKKSAQVSMIQFHTLIDKNQKRDLWLKAINTLRAGNHLKEAVRLAAKYENYFFKNKKVRIDLLKLYISSGDLKKAKELSKKILKKKKL